MKSTLPLSVTLASAALVLGGCANGGLFGNRNERVYNPRVVSEGLADNDVIYRDAGGRYYCRRENGTTGTLVGAGAGALLGSLIAPSGSKTVGALLGGVGGGVAGRSIDRADLACR